MLFTGGGNDTMQNTSTTCTTLRAIVMGDNKRMFYVGVVEGEREESISVGSRTRNTKTPSEERKRE